MRTNLMQRAIFAAFASPLLAACDNQPKSPDTSSVVAAATTTPQPEVKNIPNDWEKFPGTTDYELWSPTGEVEITDAFDVGPNGAAADHIRFAKPVGKLAKVYKDIRPKAGDALVGRVWVWSAQDKGKTVVLQIVRACANTPTESATQQHVLTSEPAMIEVRHVFENDHECVRLQLGPFGEAVEFNAWNASLLSQ